MQKFFIQVDELHERDAEIDFLLIVIRKLLRKSPDTKVVLMSATMDVNTFAEYFKELRSQAMMRAPVLKVEGRTHEIKVNYLDDVLELAEYNLVMNFD